MVRMKTIIFPSGLCVLAALLCSASARADDEPKPACKYVRLAELPLHYTGSALQVTTEGIINGKPAIMLVDTGASSMSLSRTLTERLDLNLSMTGRYAEGIGGYSRIYSARVDEFAIGPSKAGRGRLQVIGDTGSAPEYDAIAGAPFLLQTDLEVSLAEKKLRFFRGKDCSKAFLGYWPGEIFEIPFERHNDRSPNPHFTIEVNGAKLDAIIDSGATTTSIMAGAAKRAGLKIDAPGSKRLGYAVGIGSDRIERWSTIVDTMRVGGELIKNAEISVLDTDTPIADVMLGDDYLRAHRVLFAMSQEKLYISYIGGEPFKQRRGLEQWIVQEAESGNPDAQLAMAGFYRSGNGVPRDPRQADTWLEKAAASGHPQANLRYGVMLLGQHRYADAVARLRAALDKLPAERYGALWLYAARLHVGAPDVARRELEAAFAHDEHDEWPTPLADFYLGRIDAAALLDAAGKDRKQSKSRSCIATNFMAALYDAQGDRDKAQAMKTSLQAHCGAAPASK
jgi:predicted aspartyl protease